jgi:hypothetical protein
MLNRFLILFMSLLAVIVLAACSSNSDAPARAVEGYLNTLVAKDADRLPSLVCGDWEEDALIELDSFQAVRRGSMRWPASRPAPTAKLRSSTVHRQYHRHLQ